MQQKEDKDSIFNKAAGELIKEIRKEKTSASINKFAREYDFDRGNFSKLERGLVNCRLITAWKFLQAAGIEFSEFAKRLEEKLGKDFSLIDE